MPIVEFYFKCKINYIIKNILKIKINYDKNICFVLQTLEGQWTDTFNMSNYAYPYTLLVRSLIYPFDVFFPFFHNLSIWV